MKNISILKKIQFSLKEFNQYKQLNFPPAKFTSDFHFVYSEKFKYERSSYRKATVFFLLREVEETLYVVFTRRSKNLSSHPGQISFPGGRIDKDDPTIVDAGFREVEEEIGLKKENIETLGLLPPHETVSQFIIYPFVGFIKKPTSFFINKNEVEELFFVPLFFLLNNENMQYHEFSQNKQRGGYFAVPYGPYYIWGATARIIKSFVEKYQSYKYEVSTTE